mmetsp:Transcript_29452/g.67724  ORF Transcript_29452/g.67724 Transcript_29452/m.67724 type:complete len:90 (+) Transcript_29452:733-1002(+)
MSPRVNPASDVDAFVNSGCASSSLLYLAQSPDIFKFPLHPAQNTIEDQLTELPTSLEKRSVVNLDCSHCLWKEAWHTSYEKIKNASMIL